MDKTGRILEKYVVTYGTRLNVEEGQEVKQGTLLAEWDPYASVILTEFAGRIAFG